MNIFKKTKQFILNHKIATIFIVLVIVGGAYYSISKYRSSAASAPKYVISAVQKGSIVSSVTGSGQVSASDQIDIKSKASGDIISLNAKVGQELSAGAVIAQIDSRDARINLESAQIALKKLTQPADATTLLQNQNTLTKSYDSGFNSVASTFLDFPDVINGMHDLLYTSTGYLSDQKIQSLSDISKANRNTAGLNFDAANKKYNKNIALYQTTTRTSSSSQIEDLINETYDTVKDLTDSVKDAKNAVEYIKNQQLQQSQTDVTTAETNLSGWTDKMNSHLTDLLSAKNAISEAKSSLNKVQQGTDPLDIQSQQLSLQQKQNAYEDTFVRAPFDGVLAQISVNEADSVGNGTVIGTFITKQKIANITLNEVDAAKVKVGQPATLTFDAIDGLTIAAKVAEVDLVGAVSQGVVNYNVKIAFDTQDERVKSGMSASAAIVVSNKQDVVVVPNSAIKIQGNNHYVDMVDKNTQPSGAQGITLAQAPTQQPIEIGASDDTSTEIVSGVSEGDKIVTKTITSSTATAASTAPSLFGSGGRNSNSVIRTGGAGGR